MKSVFYDLLSNKLQYYGIKGKATKSKIDINGK